MKKLLFLILSTIILSGCAYKIVNVDHQEENNEEMKIKCIQTAKEEFDKFKKDKEKSKWVVVDSETRYYYNPITKKCLYNYSAYAVSGTSNRSLRGVNDAYTKEVILLFNSAYDEESDYFRESMPPNDYLKQEHELMGGLTKYKEDK